MESAEVQNELPRITFPSFALGVALVVASLFLFVLIKSRNAGLEHVPGPRLSKYTDLLRAYYAVKYFDRSENAFEVLHRRYGNIVRVGPRSVAVNDPLAIPSIYGVKARLDKGPNVRAFSIPGQRTSILGICEEEPHARVRRPIQGAYSLSFLKGYEGYVDETIDILSKVLDQHATDGRLANLSLLVYFWSYDTIGKLTFGEPYGYVEKEADFNGLIHRQRQFKHYINLVTNAPFLHTLLLDNPILKLFPNPRMDFVDFTRKKVRDRMATYDSAISARPDLLSHFLEARKLYPDTVDDEQVFTYCLTNVIAGSLSTSHVLDEIVRFLVVSPEAQHRINGEVSAKKADQTWPVSFSDAKTSPYLEAVIQEGIRVHMLANLSSERVVGPHGLVLPTGVSLPPGTYVGINPEAVKRRPEIFGANPHEFDPLRWMKHDKETEGEFIERRKTMDRADLTFGHGSRSCLGKNIVQLELYKLIASLCIRYNFDGSRNQQLWKVFCQVVMNEKTEA